MSEQENEQPQEQRPQISEDEIRRRAYELSESGEGGTDEENWRRAEEELRGGGIPGP